MNRVYAALAPGNLRVVGGPAVFVRGAQPRFAFELLNTSGAPLDLSMPGGQRTLFPLGAYQTWIEPLTDGVSLDGCAPQLGRRGPRVAAGGRQVRVVSHAVGQPFEPDDGLTITASLPTQLTECLPAGRYRLTVEYLRLDTTGGPIAATALDLQVTDPSKWSAKLTTGGSTVATSLTRVRDGQTLSASFVVTGMQSGGWAWLAIRAGSCGAPGAALMPPATLLARGTGTDRLTLSSRLTTAALRTLSQAGRLSVWATINEATSCALLTPAASARVTDRAPSTWGGGSLHATDPATGIRVTASSEIVGGSVAHLVDGQTGNAWNSGGSAPAWVEIDLGRNTRVTGLRLMPSQLPSPAATVHRIYGRVSGSLTEALIAEVRGVTTDGMWTDVAFKGATTVRYLRVETVQSPSWVAWREITVLGPALPKPSQMPIGTHDITGGIVGPGECVTAGWSVDPDDAARHVTVRILVDGKEVWRGPADLPRGDVLAAGHGHGSNGFSVNVYSLLKPGDWHEVRVQAMDNETGRWVDLNLTPRTLNCF